MRAFKTSLRIARGHWIYALIFLVAVNMLGLLTGVAQGGRTTTELAQADVPLAVIDRDGSPVSAGLTAFMEANGEAVALEDSRRAMQDALAQDRVELIAIIPSGLGNGVEKAAEQARGGTALSDAEAAVPRVDIVLAPSSSEAPLMAEQVTAYVEQALAYRATTAGNAEQAVAAATTSMRASAPARVIAEEAAPMPTAFMVFLSMALYSIFAFTTNIASLIMRVLGRRPLRVRMSASPEPVMRRNIGLSAGLAVIGIVGWAVTYILGVGALGLRTLSTALPLHGVAATALLAYAMVGIAVGFLMGQLRMSENASNAVANIGGLVFSFLGGAWLPLSYMPDAVKQVSALTPAYWANQPIREAFQSSSTSAEALAPLYGDIGVCALFAVAITAVGMAVGRARLRSAAA
ncbi:hypothetical protein CHIBA101_2006 [Actinomyces sp. Chiba101]|uniref:ABC transporter permease n=1 Tax=Actinomyces TaxID=1654 RepID=UPI000974EBDA|nr:MULTISPECIES: ABC transporter permease [Actinomyces]BAW93838.1 hypothetical protein CHIBA101_2006 [Actinomyces sp. Chiba101]GAV93909.1 hypothetical protein ADENT20671_0674 [Actinomyces denticolens]SUU74344.1 ABC-2 family transporter protein [Actinomyces denticolens]